jgi:FOG: TPR repeat, SEL1 subfamily
MRYLVFIISFCLILFSSCQKQSFIKAGDDCFDKGDYQCAKQNYTEQKSLGSEKEMEKKIELCNTCMNTIALAEFFFTNKSYQQAKEKYEELLKNNSKDPRAKSQLELCNKQLEAIASGSEIPGSEVSGSEVPGSEAPGFVVPNDLDNDPAQQNARGASFFNEKKYSEAVEWYRKSAEQGNASGQANLGYMYSNGYGITKDYAEAIKWYRKSADQGDAVGQVNLGFMYRNGFGVAKDEAEAVKWYRKSAEQGNSVGQRNMGVVYENGIGVTQDYAEAMGWYRKSVEQGDVDAQIGLGNMYFSGKGVETNYVEAFNLFLKSAEQGHIMGQYNAGLMYESGMGVTQDRAEALKWYTKASEQGHANAKKAVERLSGN